MNEYEQQQEAMKAALFFFRYTAGAVKGCQPHNIPCIAKDFQDKLSTLEKYFKVDQEVILAGAIQMSSIFFVKDYLTDEQREQFAFKVMNDYVAEWLWLHERNRRR
jgi:hypothetical protein